MYFCESKFWDSNLTWYTEQPQLTPCFQSTVLVYTPALSLVLLGVWDLVTCYHSRSRTVPWSGRLIAKVSLTSVALAIALLELVSAIYAYTKVETLFLADILAPVVKISSFLISLGLLMTNKHFGQVVSNAQFLFWTANCLCLGLSTLSEAFGSIEDVPFTEIVLMISGLVVSVIMFILNCFADLQPLYSEWDDQADENDCPRKLASVPSRVLYTWMDSLLFKGFRHPLTSSDLWNLNPEDRLTTTVPALESKLDKDNVSILVTLFKCHWPTFILLTVLYISKTLLSLVNPQIIDMVISFVEEDQETWKGYLYMILFGAVTLGTTMFDTIYWTMVLLMTMRVYSSLAAIIYKKSLKLSANSRSQYSSGEIINLIAVDATKIQEALTYVTFLWVSPFHVALTTYFTWQIIGPAVLVGLGVLVAAIPLNGLDFYFMEKFQTKQMDHKDMRVKLINEILAGMKVLKMYSWEKPFIDKIGEIRQVELHSMKWVQYLDAFLFFTWNSAPFLVAVSSFITYIYIDPENNVLDAKTAFVSLSLFNTLQAPFFLIPYAVQCMVQASVSVTRINKFLNSEELDPNNTTSDEMGPTIIAKNAYFTWGERTDLPVLKNLNFSVKKGTLVAVVGRVGSGKSSLLSALLGEMQRTNGFVNIGKSIAYVSQQAWIRNMTLKNNILFQKPFNNNFYNKVIQCSALEPDLEQLTGGDQTEIGEKGINLSGGQKQRVNLARAIYANKDIYLLDDPLSAVDSHVGKHIFEKVLGEKGMLSKKTRILVTHAISYLPLMDNIIVMKDGSISEIGTYQELLNNKGEFADFLIEQLQNTEEESDEDNQNENEELWKTLETSIGTTEVSLKKQLSRNSKNSRKNRTSSIGELSDIGSSLNDETMSIKEKSSVISRGLSKDESELNGKFNIVEIEEVETEGVKFEHYVYYFKSMGAIVFFLCILAYAIFQSFSVATNLVLTAWSNVASNDTSVTNYYMGLYGGFGALQSLFIFLAGLIYTYGSIKSSTLLHSNLLQNIMNAPMSFFDTTPAGRIVNRFSKDMDDVDAMIPFVAKDLINQVFILLGIIFVLVFVSPIVLALIVPIVIFFIFMRALYLNSARQLKRMMATNRSPINSHLEETLSGANTIRAFQFQESFIEENVVKIHNLLKSWFIDTMVNQWAVWRLESIGTIMVVVITLIIVLNRDDYTSGVVGLMLSYSLTAHMSVYWLTRVSADLEKAIVSVERIKEYSSVEGERDTVMDHGLSLTYQAQEDWPSRGEIRFEGYSTRYRAGLDLVLSDLSCSINGGEKVGIVGRTGAGKSSITLALFRIIEAAGGSICIDNVNIAAVGLERLRTAITIIPQDPVLFSGSLRYNLDPFGRHSDQDLWRVLRMSHLTDLVNKLTGNLDHVIVEGGTNLSVGQRQLVCLARAILRKTKILVLDEATAAVDLETDDLIQATIREEFSDCTVLTIAHRIKTILDSDRVLVMQNGSLSEFDRPQTLLADTDSAFYKMSQDAGVVG